MAEFSFFWHDYETFGRVPRRDRPVQFAGVRTDADLNEIGEPVNWFCQPAPDTLPDPEACLLTGILPQQALRQGLAEHEFAARIEAELMTSITKRIETQTVQSEANVYNGSSITLAVEQPFWKNTHVLLGATVSLTTNPYQSWFLYDTFRDRLLTTEFFMGFVL